MYFNKKEKTIFISQKDEESFKGIKSLKPKTPNSNTSSGK